MANGFFLGGMAEGIETGRAGMRAQEALGLEREGLGLRRDALAQDASQFDRKIGLDEKALSLKEKAMKRDEIRAATAQVDEAIANTMKLASATIQAGLAVNRPIDQIRKTVTPLLSDVQGLAGRIGRDPSIYARQLDAQLTLPGAEEAAAAEGRATVAKQKAIAEGGMSPLEPKQKVEVENSLRDDYLKQSAPFIEVNDAWNRIQGIKDTGAGDVALLYSYMKLIDPGSTVREGELALAQQASGVPARVLNLYNSVVRGEQLPPEMRKGFREQAKSLFDRQSSAQKRLRDQFEAIAKRQGVDARNVVIDFTTPETDAVPPPDAGALPPLPDGFVEVN